MSPSPKTPPTPALSFEDQLADPEAVTSYIAEFFGFEEKNSTLKEEVAILEKYENYSSRAMGTYEQNEELLADLEKVETASALQRAEDAEQKCKSLEARNSELECQVVLLENLYSADLVSVNRFYEEKSTLKNQIIGLEGLVKELDEQIQDSEAVIQDGDEKRVALESENLKLRQKCEDFEKMFHRCQEARKNNLAENISLKAEKKDMEKRSLAISRRCSSLSDEAQPIIKEHQLLKLKNDELTKENQELKFKAQRGNTNHASTELERWKLQAFELEQKLYACQAEKQGLQGMIDSFATLPTDKPIDKKDEKAVLGQQILKLRQQLVANSATAHNREAIERSKAQFYQQEALRLNQYVGALKAQNNQLGTVLLNTQGENRRLAEYVKVRGECPEHDHLNPKQSAPYVASREAKINQLEQEKKQIKNITPRFSSTSELKISLSSRRLLSSRLLKQ
jgi:hypothetical protein